MTDLKRTLAVCAAIVIVGAGVSVQATPKAANVPPTQEIVVLDPNADPLSRPAVQTKPSGIPGLLEVDVPRPVIVHRYYYTGDRSFQAQFLPGGPCIVVVNHPKTAERLYLPVQMPPGAPRVIYTAHAIEYDFGNHGVTVRFGPLSCAPKVEYRNCMTIGRRFENSSAKAGAVCQEFSERTGISGATQAAVAASKNACKDTADFIGCVGRGIATPVIQFGKLLPGAQLLCTTDEDRAMRLRDAQNRAAEKAAANQGVTIPSNR